MRKTVRIAISQVVISVAKISFAHQCENITRTACSERVRKSSPKSWLPCNAGSISTNSDAALRTPATRTRCPRDIRLLRTFPAPLNSTAIACCKLPGIDIFFTLEKELAIPADNDTFAAAIAPEPIPVLSLNQPPRHHSSNQEPVTPDASTAPN
jgi:hypothetical protein